MPVVTQIQFRRGTAAQWTASNPVLAQGELGYETDTGNFKIGNGSTAWNSLAVLNGITASTTATFTNKTINLASNTLTGTIAQFNTALSDGDFATLAGSETLTNKTINLANNTLSATSAQIATAVSDETGSGSLVFGTAPTLSTPSINNPRWGYSTTATAAGTTTLTATSNFIQLFTGTTTQTVVMPVTSTLVAGQSWEINNNSTGTLTVNSSGGNLITTIPGGSSYAITCIGTTLTTAADWEAEFNGSNSITGTGAVVLATSPTLTTPNIGVATGTSFNSITGLSSTTPAVDGTAAVGTATTAARADHVHPTDTSRAATAGTLAQFAATTSAQLAGVISDETGSGSLVFGTSPTIGGTLTASGQINMTATNAVGNVQDFQALQIMDCI